MNKHKKGMGRKPGGREWAKERRLRTVGYASLGLVGAIGMMALFPLGASDTNAAETIDVSYTAKTSLSVKVDPSITLVGTDAVTNRGFVSGSANLTVATSNSTGYSVFMTTADGNTALTNTTNAGAKINSIASDTVGKNMGSNVWGWTFDGSSLDTTYHPIPANANTAIHKTNTASANEGDSYSLSFGANVDNSLPAGDYNSSILVSVIGNYVPVGDATDISQIKTMQEMNATVCSNMTSEQQYQLEDARDGKTYYIARLKDGHCWMTQNLDYETEGIKQLGTPGENVPDNAWRGGNLTSGHDSPGNYYSHSLAATVCPTGWRLPSNDEYKTLISGVKLTAALDSPYYFVTAKSVPVKSGSLIGSNNLWTGTQDSSAGPTGPGSSGADVYYVVDLTSSGVDFVITRSGGVNAKITISSEEPYTTTIDYLTGYAMPIRCILK